MIKLLISSIFTTKPKLIVRHFSSKYEIKILFHLQKMFIFSKKLFVCRSITCQGNVISQTFYPTNRS